MSAGQVSMTLSGKDARWLKAVAQNCGVHPAEIVRRMIAAEQAKDALPAYLLPVPKLDDLLKAQ